MPTLFDRHYARSVKAISKTELAVGAGILMLLAAIVGAYVGQLATEPPSRRETGFPAGLSEWRVPAQFERFTPDNLFEKINGRADFYLKFHFQELQYGSYSHVTDAGRTVDVYCYVLTTPADAKSAYDAERPPQHVSIQVGDEGYEAGGAVFFRQGNRYLQVLPSQFTAAGAADARHLAKQLAESPHE